MFDLILSIVILTISIGLAFSYFVNVQSNESMFDSNKKLVSGFTTTKINQLNNEEIRGFFKDNKIRNIENTIAQQVGEFYSEGSVNDSINLTNIIVEDYVPKQLNVLVELDANNGTVSTLFNRSKKSIENAEISSVLRRDVFGFVNETDFYGPYTFNFQIWS